MDKVPCHLSLTVPVVTETEGPKALLVSIEVFRILTEKNNEINVKKTFLKMVKRREAVSFIEIFMVGSSQLKYLLPFHKFKEESIRPLRKVTLSNITYFL